MTRGAGSNVSRACVGTSHERRGCFKSALVLLACHVRVPVARLGVLFESIPPFGGLCALSQRDGGLGRVVLFSSYYVYANVICAYHMSSLLAPMLCR